jgi:hypothetical protein
MIFAIALREHIAYQLSQWLGQVIQFWIVIWFWFKQMKLNEIQKETKSTLNLHHNFTSF